MSILFEECRYRNILSTGNAWTTINLNKAKSTLIVGQNGAGKSTLLDAIAFALYGKAFRKINKPQLLNSINQKDLMVEVKFKTNGHSYTIKRGIKPTIFEIWKNGVLLNQDASSRDYQAYLEENILKMNYKSFGQVIVLGSSTFVPFMQLPAFHRREVIEDLLDIQIFSTMNTLLKERVNQNKDDSSEVKYRIDLIKNNIASAKSHNESIKAIRADEVQRIKNKIKEQLNIIEEENLRLDNVSAEIIELQSSIEDKNVVSSRKSSYVTLESDLKSKLSALNKEIIFYNDHDNCPTCKQGIEHDFKIGTVETKKKKIHDIQLSLADLLTKTRDVDTRLTEIRETENKITKLNISIGEIRTNIKIAKSSLMVLKTEYENAMKSAEEIDTTKITNLENDLRLASFEAEKLISEREILNVVGSMLKDGGIKTRIIKQYVPIMNKLINKYLAAMDFFVDFQLDQNFNEKILSRFRDEFSYASFSEGEKLRIDLALMFTWRAVSKLRNSVTTNLLIMDEVLDGSLDNAGTEEFLRIINELASDTNVFIISHKGDTLYDKFDDVIRFKKIKNFSVIAGDGQ